MSYFAGEINMIVSPRINAVPIFLLSSPASRSSASSRTTLIWISNAFSVPISCFWFFSSTITLLSLALFNASNGLNASGIVSHPENKSNSIYFEKKGFVYKGYYNLLVILVILWKDCFCLNRKIVCFWSIKILYIIGSYHRKICHHHINSLNCWLGGHPQRFDQKPSSQISDNIHSEQSLTP